MTPSAATSLSARASPSVAGRAFLPSRGRAASRGACRGLTNRISAMAGENKKVLVIGGTGRVGASTANSLAEGGGVDVVLGGRSRENAEAMQARWPALKGTSFQALDLNDPASLVAAMEGVDLVVHTAGPFQRATKCHVLESCIATKTPYIDVCDDEKYSQMAKGLHEKAVAAGVPAITTTGIYPGVSNLMAAEMVEGARNKEEPTEPARVRYSYFTAGSGGAGETILTTSFLLCGEPVTVFKDNEKMTLKATDGKRTVDFGKGVGSRNVFLYNLPETYSTHKYLKVPSVSARFGTAPGIWNTAMGLVATLVPKAVLQNPAAIKPLVMLSLPFVRLVDPLVGELTAIRVEVEMENGVISTGQYVHKQLSVCVGQSTAAFAREVLRGGTQPGVWFPEEGGAVADRRAVLDDACKGARSFVLNAAPWQLESTPINMGMGMYYEP